MHLLLVCMQLTWHCAALLVVGFSVICLLWGLVHRELLFSVCREMFLSTYSQYVSLFDCWWVFFNKKENKFFSNFSSRITRHFFFDCCSFIVNWACFLFCWSLLKSQQQSRIPKFLPCFDCNLYLVAQYQVLCKCSTMFIFLQCSCIGLSVLYLT